MSEIKVKNPRQSVDAPPQAPFRSALDTPGPPPASIEGPEPGTSSASDTAAWRPVAGSENPLPLPGRQSFLTRLAEVNKELWLIMSLLALAAVLNYLVTAHSLVLSFYTLPTLFSAYFFGRRHATLTAFASMFLVALLGHFNPAIFSTTVDQGFLNRYWYDLFAWGGMLVMTAYAMGTLHERHTARVQELQQMYHGLLLILRQFIDKDPYTENHAYRVSIYAASLATELGFSPERVETVRAAALLHDIGRPEISRRLLARAARVTEDEYEELPKNAHDGLPLAEPVGGPLRRILPIILAHHERHDGPAFKPGGGQVIPFESRIIAVADAYDDLTSERPYRTAMSLDDGREIILKGAGTEFDPRVVAAFDAAFRKGDLVAPEIFF